MEVVFLFLMHKSVYSLLINKININAKSGTVNSFAQISLDILAEV